ncbi:MAG TPA: hypothetical protein VLJ10_04750 [Candidatus Bathyarchaeia archaeon]|nr:hypothetical protein [Candidatus Bathyarchaeia archaeon]
MKYFSLLLISFLLSAALSFAQSPENQPLKTFQLTDGTTLKGYLLDIENDGAYLVDTTKLGVISIPADEVVRMTQETLTAPAQSTQQPQLTIPAGLQNSPTVGALSGNASATIQQAQHAMLSDPAINQAIQQLMADPEMMRLLQDPQFIQRLMNMNPADVQSDPVVQKLLQNPVMMEIIQRTGAKMMGQNTFPVPTASNP